VQARRVNAKNFFTELKRRNVYRAAVAYGVVAWFLTQLTTQIHSFRASAVISVQALFAAALDSMAFRKSAGSLCTVPPAIF
jgi:hypothetical protein